METKWVKYRCEKRRRWEGTHQYSTEGEGWLLREGPTEYIPPEWVVVRNRKVTHDFEEWCLRDEVCWWVVQLKRKGVLTLVVVSSSWDCEGAIGPVPVGLERYIRIMRLVEFLQSIELPNIVEVLERTVPQITKHKLQYCKYLNVITSSFIQSIFVYWVLVQMGKCVIPFLVEDIMNDWNMVKMGYEAWVFNAIIP